MIFYVAARRVSLAVFTLFNSIGTIIWLAVLIPLGWLAGRGLEGAASALGTIEIAVAVFVVSIIVFRIVSVWITKKIGSTQ